MKLATNKHLSVYTPVHTHTRIYSCVYLYALIYKGESRIRMNNFVVVSVNETDCKPTHWHPLQSLGSESMNDANAIIMCSDRKQMLMCQREYCLYSVCQVIFDSNHGFKYSQIVEGYLLNTKTILVMYYEYFVILYYENQGIVFDILLIIIIYNEEKYSE